MVNSVRSIPLEKLVGHPDNPNRQSKVNFAKLVRNIERTGRYEPLVVRPCPRRQGFFQIINGHHRRQALEKLGYETADCVVWDIDDEQTDILLATLNRLSGTDRLDKKLALLKRMSARLGTSELAKLIPQRRRQIERLISLKMPARPAAMNAKPAANPVVFFLDDRQERVVEEALSLAEDSQHKKTKAGRKAGALTYIAEHFLGHSAGGPIKVQ